MASRLEIAFEITDEEILLETNIESLSVLNPNDLVLYSTGHTLIAFHSFLQVAPQEDVQKVVTIVNEALANHKRGLN